MSFQPSQREMYKWGMDRVAQRWGGGGGGGGAQAPLPSPSPCVAPEYEAPVLVAVISGLEANTTLKIKKFVLW